MFHQGTCRRTQSGHSSMFIPGVQGDGMLSLPAMKPQFNFINVKMAASHAPEQTVYAKISFSRLGII